MVAGALLPIPTALQENVQVILTVMLFFVFLETRLEFRTIRRTHLRILGANIGIALAAWAVCLPIGRAVAEAAFFAAIAPTATAAAAITGMLGGHVGFVVTSFLLTNCAAVILFPVLIPLITSGGTPSGFTSVALSMLLVVCIPLGAAVLLRRLLPALERGARVFRNVSFVLWLIGLTAVSARVVTFLQSSEETGAAVFSIVALITLSICTANFLIGRRLGSPDLRLEAGQSLGQKNTVLTLYVALAHANPIAALGPAFYIVWHNLWNAWQMSRRRP
jgi:BASS family bile acid:Na+ symporter